MMSNCNEPYLDILRDEDLEILLHLLRGHARSEETRGSADRFLGTVLMGCNSLTLSVGEVKYHYD